MLLKCEHIFDWQDILKWNTLDYLMAAQLLGLIYSFAIKSSSIYIDLSLYIPYIFVAYNRSLPSGSNIQHGAANQCPCLLQHGQCTVVCLLASSSHFLDCISQ